MDCDREAIEKLIYAYAERIDLGDFDGVATLLAGATYRSEGTPPVAGEELAAVLRATIKRHDRGTQTKHVTTNVVVEVNAQGETATSRSYFTVMQAAGGVSLQPIMSGRYHDRFEMRDGQWRFADRIILMDLIGDISEHVNSKVARLLMKGREGT